MHEGAGWEAMDGRLEGGQQGDELPERKAFSKSLESKESPHPSHRRAPAPVVPHSAVGIKHVPRLSSSHDHRTLKCKVP